MNMIKKSKYANILLSVVIALALMLIIIFTGCDTAKDSITDASDEIIIENDNAQDDKDVDLEKKDYPDGSNEITDEVISLMDTDITDYINSLEPDTGQFLELTRQDREYLIELAYDTIKDYFSDGITEEKSYPSKYKNIANEVHVVLRVDGRKICWDFAESNNLAESVGLAVKNVMDDENTDSSFIEDNLWKLAVEIIIKGEEKELDGNFERGIHGVIVRYGQRNAIALSMLSVEGNISIESIIDNLYVELGLDPEGSYEDLKIYYFPTIHFAGTPFDDDVVSLYRCSDSELIPDVTEDKIFGTLELAEGWMLLNLDEDGYFNYGYSPSTGEYFTTNNMIRQLLSSRWLAEESRENKSLVQMHKINLDYILRNWYVQEGELGYIYFGNKSKLGAMAMAISTIARSPLYDDYKEYAEKLANTILSMQHDDGSFDAWFVEPDYDYDEESLLRFYSGEGMLGIIELYERSGEEKYLEAAELSQGFYIKKYVENIDENYSPAYVPWQTMCLNKLYKITGDRKYIEPIFILNDRLIEMQNQTGEPYPDFLGRFYDPQHPEYGPPNSGSTSPYVESLAYAYEIAKMEDDRARMAEYKKAIVLGIHNLMNLQFKGSDMYYLGHPERVEGALRYRMYDNRIRIDTTQHTIDAIEKVIEVFALDQFLR
jgi:hypothetical protein